MKQSEHLTASIIEAYNDLAELMEVMQYLEPTFNRIGNLIEEIRKEENK